MASQLTDIIAAIAGLTVTVSSSIAYGTKTPQVFSGATLPDTEPDARLPVRLVRMLRVGDAGAQSFVVEFGNTNLTRVQWRIYDVLLWRRLGTGLRVGSQEADLTAYAAAYVVALNSIPAPTSRSRIIGATALVQEVNEPVGSDFWYSGVICTIDVEERLVDTAPTPWG